MSELYKGGIKNVNSINHEDIRNVAIGEPDKKVEGYNFFGEPVYGKGRLADGVPGHYDSNGIPHPNYQKPNTDVDGNGFDLHHPVIWHYHVPKGTVIIRFGNEYGRFLSTEDACFDNLAIGLDIHSIPYRKYLVTTDDFYVTKGVVGDQSNFGIHGKGGAIQYMAEKPVISLIADGILKEI